MAENFKDTIIEIIEQINEIGLTAVKSKGTKNFEEKVNCLFKYIVQKYYYLLLASNRISEERISERLEREEVCRMDITLKDYSKRVESLITAYQAVCKEIRVIEKIVNDYKSQGNEYDFFWFAENKYFKKIKARAIRDEYFKFKQGGMRVGKREGFLISKCLKFLDEKLLENFDEGSMIEFASINGYKIEKVKKAWSMHEKLKYKSLDSVFYDDEGDAQEVYVVDEAAEARYDEILNNDLFMSYIKLLNIAYYKDFTANMQKCYPHIFTNKYIEEIIKEAKNQTKSRSEILTIKNHWDEIKLEWYRDTYATKENVCVLRDDFDWAIENRKYRTQKMVAELLGVSAQYISDLNKSVEKLLKRKVVEKHYAEQ